jgi:protein-tyrosine-phosphatase
MCDLADALSSYSLLVAGARHETHATAASSGGGGLQEESAAPTEEERRAAFGTHSARLLTPAIAADADLILCAERNHRSAVIALAPAKRTAVFTVRQAGRLAQWIVGDGGVAEVGARRSRGEPVELPPGDFRALVPALPVEPLARLHWLLDELDANRGMAPATDRETYPQWDIDDVGDPHVLGYQIHDQSVRCTVDAASAIAGAFSVLVTMT